MAEAFLNRFGGDRFTAESAGIEPGEMNPTVVKSMNQIGIDLSHNASKSIESMIARGPFFDYVVTVCDETSAERCPAFPGPGRRLHWPFDDPSSFGGSEAEKLAATGAVRDAIRKKVERFVAERAT